MENLLSHGTITLVFILMGVGLYFVINYLFDSIGKGGIDRVFEMLSDTLQSAATANYFLAIQA